MSMTSIRTIIALMLIALPVGWGSVLAQDLFQPTTQSITQISETGNILLFGVTLLMLSSYMRVRSTR